MILYQIAMLQDSKLQETELVEATLTLFKQTEEEQNKNQTLRRMTDVTNKSCGELSDD